MVTIISEENYLAHYGILRKSGRYPWGSGKDPHQRSQDFFSYVGDLRKGGLTDTEIARGLGWTSTQFREAASIARNAKRAGDQSNVQRLKDKGMSNLAISRQTGLPEATVRSLLTPGLKDKLTVLESTANVLRQSVADKKYVDVGMSTEFQLGISRQKMDTALAVLKDEGYSVHPVKIQQLGTGHMTELKVLVAPGVTQKEAWLNRNNVQQIQNFTEDGGRSFFGIHEPISISSNRVGVRYAEEGGNQADGVIYVRPGVHDLSMGAARYAQVRIMVDGSHYLKGMAVYKDDLPPGVDLLFNTNKSSTGNKLDALKPLKKNKQTGEVDQDNPFGAIIRQRVEKDEHGRERVTSALNIVGSPGTKGSGEEGSWSEWSRTLSSQFLSKQAPLLAKKQLDMAYEQKRNELNGILALNNPAVKKMLLEKFADGADSSAWHLKAAHLPRQMSHVILPIPSMKPTEIYAPNFRHGERVVLVRHPHGGVFEIPELVVNNRQPDAVKLLGPGAQGRKHAALDAVGIHHSVADKLSGADFDGDTVLVIPNNSGAINHKPMLRQLQGFDAKRTYPEYPGMKVMTSRQTQTEMGKISNLITDMTLKGAKDDELARAVKHSMVVIDAEKHKLNYRQSAIDHGINQLKKKYQGGVNEGAATLISRKKKETPVPARKPRTAGKGGPIDTTTGRRVFEPTNEFRVKNGVRVPKEELVKKVLEVKDVRELSSGTKMENLYADHSNRLKDIANEARLASLHTGSVKWNPSAKTPYSAEIGSLQAKLQISLRNAPLERQAQVLANAVFAAKRLENPDMEQSEIKKVKAQTLDEMRTRTGAGKSKITLTQEEWNAIQAGAISNNQLTEILKHADLDQVKALATPRQQLLMTSAKKARASEMLALGYTQADVASALGVSLTTLKTNLIEGS